jgi:carboxymethylenebutenolidase
MTMKMARITIAILMAMTATVYGEEIVTVPDSDAAEAALQNSPRHGEFIFLDLPGSDVKMKTWVVYPERSDKAPVVLVIHEILGMTDWVNSVADHLASEGFIAIAPNMVYGLGGEENAMTKVRNLPEDERARRLEAARKYALQIPAANGKVGSIGFCWGGGVSFHYAATQPDLDAAVACYGTAPDTALLKNANAPILGLYGGDDARVTATIDGADAEMKRLGKFFEYEIYPGAGHGFFRQQKGRNGANLKAAQQGWVRAVTFLRENLED